MLRIIILNVFKRSALEFPVKKQKRDTKNRNTFQDGESRKLKLNLCNLFFILAYEIYLCA